MSLFLGELACKLVNALPIFVISASVYSLVAMSYERQKAITQSEASINKHNVKYIIIVIWVTSFTLMIPTLIEYTVYEETIVETLDLSTNVAATESSQYVSDIPINITDTSYTTITKLLKCGSNAFTRTLSIINGSFLLMFSYMIPLIALGYNYSKLIYFISKQSKISRTSLSNSVVSKKKIKILKMLCIVALLFVMSWMPYFTLLIIAVSIYN